jgi:cyclic pyranopterin phosphate synthase
MLIDSFGRHVTYLRISVTDRCNLRCVYCMPSEGIEWQPHDTIMQYEEIAQFVKLAASQGIREVRLTGGEPLIRKNLPDLVHQLSVIPGIEDISLTTNGLLLENLAEKLAGAGLTRVNVSFDTMRPALFKKITRGGSLEKVWNGILAAERYNLTPIKLNTVILKGINSDEIEELAKLTLDHDWSLRFIELMPISNQAPWGGDFPKPEEMYFPISEVRTRLEKFGFGPIRSHVIGEGPSEEYRIKGARGSIGFISPLSKSFCKRCNRLRLTSDGNLRPCLGNDEEVPILAAMRNGEDILPLLQKAIQLKPENHKLDQASSLTGRCMMQIGG